jgi:phosphoribosylanthranilate isomerase
MWVKICGNTSLEDAAEAARCGATALGFIFARSPRQITAEHVATITGALPTGVERVGVFDSRDAAEVIEIAGRAGVKTLQLHGGFDLALLEQIVALHRFEVIQVLHRRAGSDVRETVSEDRETLAQLRSVAELSRGARRAVRILVDSQTAARSGGTGTTYDWAAAAELFRVAGQLGVPAIAAGGLRPSNVREAIGQLAPWGVDVSSGVEHSPGKKDPVAVAQFLANAHGVEKP